MCPFPCYTLPPPLIHLIQEGPRRPGLAMAACAPLGVAMILAEGRFVVVQAICIHVRVYQSDWVTSRLVKVGIPELSIHRKRLPCFACFGFGKVTGEPPTFSCS